MKKKSLLMVMMLMFCFSISYVQAIEKNEDFEWETLLKEAREVQVSYAGEYVEYVDIRKSFLNVFTRDTMMAIFMEHLMIEEDKYVLGATDFSPYMIPDLSWTSFEVKEESEDKIILLESQHGSSELMGPEQIQRVITLAKTEQGWRISGLEWNIIK